MPEPVVTPTPAVDPVMPEPTVAPAVEAPMPEPVVAPTPAVETPVQEPTQPSSEGVVTTDNSQPFDISSMFGNNN